MLINRVEKNSKGMFYVGEESSPLAELVYHMSDPKLMVIEHTEVDDSLRGQNVGHQLVHTSVEYARQENIKVRVLCPFAKKLFDRTPEWGDVLEKL